MTEERLGVHAYARHRGCAPSSVAKAIESGRLTTSVQRDARGRPRINAAAADLEWHANTDPMMQRESQRRPRAADIVPSWPALVTLLGLIEGHASTAFREVVATTPEAPATAWQALYADWAQVAGLLERVQSEIRALANNRR